MLLQSSRIERQTGPWRPWRGWLLAAPTLGAVLLLLWTQSVVIGLGRAAESSAQEQQAAWAPKLFAFDFEASDAKRRALADEARMLREVGFDGVGYLLWLDHPDTKLRMFGEDFDKNLRTLDQAGLPLLGLGSSVNVDPNSRPYDPRMAEVIRKLKGRPVILAVMLDGLEPDDTRGEKPALKALRELGDLAAKSELRISVYHHVNSWARRFDDALRIVEKVNHPCVGMNFNLAHWLMVEGGKDYRPVLRAGAEKIFVVTICGAKVGSKTIPELIQPLDRGDFDNRELLATLREIGYRGPIGLQCFGIPGDARAHLQRSMNVWTTWKAEWAKKGP